MRITTKITVVTAIILIVIVTVQTINAVVSTNKITKMLEANDQQYQHNGLTNEINAKFDMLAMSNIPIINNAEILNAFAQRDRETLANLTLPMMDDFKAQGIQQFHFHLQDATSFFRVQSPDKYGDELSSFRETVVQANEKKQTIMGLEGGVSGVGYRYVVPLSFNNEHIGTVELGLALDDVFLSKLKDHYDSEWQLYGIEGEEAVFMDGTSSEVDISFSSEQIQKVKQGKTINELVDSHLISASPLTDFSGEVKWFLVSKKDYTTIIKQEQTVLSNILIASIVFSILGLGFLIFILRRTLKPLSVLSSNAEKIAEGDLTIEQPVFQSKDEIGQLAESFNKMSSNLKVLIKDIQTDSKKLSSDSTVINGSIAEAKEGVQNIVNAIEQINQNCQESMQSSEDTAQAMNEMTQGILRMADNTTTIVNSTNDVNSVAHEGDKAVHSAVSQMHIIEEKIEQFATVIQELDTDSHEISQIMQLITGIAEQTNLLALNAAIEAARAGEAGKGFAVVADEIRKLADQTSHSASKVYELISKIQANTNTAVDSMAANKTEVHQGIILIEQVGTMFDQISNSINSLSVEIDELSSLSEQMSASAEEVTAAVHEIAQSSVHSAESADTVVNTSKDQLDGIQEISGATTRLSDMSKHLETSVQQFKI